ncbi:hypothetical protein TESG_08245 [Trichophyton tonsurans CBS 112818]|uniref:Uncharacterized protein n=1 Tax=Trichophyton tonsurans (strain CBS 112818) TaxID=647933 RepID=F2RNC8_TRIT1|nr:hypothetical protein TESG_08245 [Trichophyton tonsurans CBS 112818]
MASPALVPSQQTAQHPATMKYLLLSDLTATYTIRESWTQRKTHETGKGEEKSEREPAGQVSRPYATSIRGDGRLTTGEPREVGLAPAGVLAVLRLLFIFRLSRPNESESLRDGQAGTEERTGGKRHPGRVGCKRAANGGVGGGREADEANERLERGSSEDRKGTNKRRAASWMTEDRRQKTEDAEGQSEERQRERERRRSWKKGRQRDRPCGRFLARQVCFFLLLRPPSCLQTAASYLFCWPLLLLLLLLLLLDVSVDGLWLPCGGCPSSMAQWLVGLAAGSSRVSPEGL